MAVLLPDAPPSQLRDNSGESEVRHPHQLLETCVIRGLRVALLLVGSVGRWVDGLDEWEGA